MRSYGVLDTSPDPLFDDLARLAARHFKVPIVLVSVIDGERQRFKARHGLAVAEIPRPQSFCAHTLLHDEGLVVADARRDERFQSIPLVAGAPGVRFYAGVPLLTDDRLALGSFCILDRRVRSGFGTASRADLAQFARLVMHELDARLDRRAVEAARAEAEEAARSKSRLLAAASHDLRQPLQSVLLFAETLVPHVLDDLGREKMTHLQRSLDTLKTLLDSLLDLSRLDAGVVTPEFENFPLCDVLAQIRSAYAPVVDAKGLAFRVEPCDVMVRSDHVLLGRMLRNLVENAVRYTERGHIVVRCREHGDRLVVEVADTGVGIPTQHLERIFEEFHQVGNPQRDRGQGMGLGLAIVRHLSKLLDHPVHVSSRSGRGSVFGFEVPLAPERSRTVTAATAGAGDTVPPAPAGGLTPPAGRLAVVVDDDAIVLLGLQTMLREWGYDVLVAGTTDRVLRQVEAANRRPDVVIVDYRLPDNRIGTEAVERIRALYGEDIPGIVLTGEIGVEPQRRAEVLNLGVISKPITPRQFRAVLDRWLPAGPGPSGG